MALEPAAAGAPGLEEEALAKGVEALTLATPGRRMADIMWHWSSKRSAGPPYVEWDPAEFGRSRDGTLYTRAFLPDF